MSTSVPRLNPSLRLVTLYLGVLLCAVLAAWATSVGLGFHVAPRTPSAALIRNVASSTSPRPSRTHSTQSAGRVSTAASRVAASSTPKATVGRSSSANDSASTFVPVTHNVEVITPSPSDTSSTTSGSNASTDSSGGDASTSSGGNASTTTTTTAGD